MVWAFFLCKVELCSFKTVWSRGWNIWGIFALFLAKLRSTSAADWGRLGRPRGPQMVSRCGIWPELSEKLSWASVAQKLSILEVKIGGTSLCSALPKFGGFSAIFPRPWPPFDPLISWQMSTAFHSCKLGLCISKNGHFRRASVNFQMIFFFCLRLCLHNWTKMFPK